MEGGQTFNEVATLYHQVRPRYPDELFGIIGSLPEITRGSRVLERGFAVTGIEPGAALAAVTRAELAGFTDFRCIETRFEDWALPEQPFGLVFSATAFHWIDRRIRVAKSAAALRRGGYLAIASYQHVAGGDIDFFETIQECYGAHMPGTRSDERLLEADQIQPATAELTRGGLFDEPTVNRWVIEESYDRDRYFELLSTYSGHRLLDDAHRTALFACIGDQIDRMPGRRVRKAYLHELIVTRKM